MHRGQAEGTSFTHSSRKFFMHSTCPPEDVSQLWMLHASCVISSSEAPPANCKTHTPGGIHQSSSADRHEGPFGAGVPMGRETHQTLCRPACQAPEPALFLAQPGREVRVAEYLRQLHNNTLISGRAGTERTETVDSTP